MNFVERIWSEISIPEILLFTAFFILLVIFILFYKSSKVQARVMEESSCYKETQQSSERGVFNVTAKVLNRPAYDITYNLGDKSSKIECACTPGDVKNEFSAIPYYDLRENTPYKDRVKYRDTLTCDCETNLSAAASDPKVSYYGEPGVVKFMYDKNNTGFFDNAIYGTNYEFTTKYNISKN